MGFNNQDALKDVLNDPSLCLLNAGSDYGRVLLSTDKYFLQFDSVIHFNIIWVFPKIIEIKVKPGQEIITFTKEMDNDIMGEGGIGTFGTALKWLHGTEFASHLIDSYTDRVSYA
jgi:hypothetical protein